MSSLLSIIFNLMFSFSVLAKGIWVYDQKFNSYCFQCSTEFISPYSGNLYTDLNAPIGFYDLHDSNIPDAVKSAAQNVFKILLFKKSGQRIWNLNEEELLAENKNATETLIDGYLQQCRINGKNLCPVPDVKLVKSASGFLLNDLSVVITAGHLLRGNRNNTLIVVQNYKGEIITHPETNPSKIEKLLLSDKKIPIISMALNEDFPTDLLKIKFKFPLVNAKSQFQNQTTQKIKSGQQIYTLGYPDCTGEFCLNRKKQNSMQFSRAPYPDSPGGQLRITIGQFLEVMSFKNNDVGFGLSDCVVGMSGGVVVDENGVFQGMNLRCVEFVTGKDIRTQEKIISRFIIYSIFND